MDYRQVNIDAELLDPKYPLRPFHYGVFQQEICIGGKKRKIVYYVPRDVRPSTSGVIILPDDGKTAESFFCNSTWKELSDTDEHKERFILCILEAGEHGWNIAEKYGSPDGDVAYVKKAYEDFSRRKLFCVHESKYYLVGYGAGATVAEYAALSEPALYAGVTAVAPKPMDMTFVETCEQDYCTNLDGYEDESHRHGIKKADIPMPVWIISDSESANKDLNNDVAVWCRHTEAEFNGHISPDTVAYVRKKTPEYALNRDASAYRVWNSIIRDASNENGYLINRRIWSEFLSKVRRWMSEPGGSLRMTEDPSQDLQCEYHYEPVDGWMREWYVYVPKTLKEGKKIPVVFAFHGYTCSGEIYMGNTGWNRVADKYGFIVVTATAINDKIKGKGENKASKFENTALPTWNIFGREGRPNEIHFFETMLEKLAEKYPIDKSRVFATGHSWGSMMTQYLGMAVSEKLTAIAPCSGVLFREHDETLLANPAVKKESLKPLPIWMFVGEQEPWLFPHIPEGDNQPAKTIRIWWQRNSVSGDAPNDFREGWTNNGRWNDLQICSVKDKAIRYTWVDYMPHATMPEMSFRIWEEFFSLY